MTEKELGNTTASQAKTNVSDLVIWGNGDMFKLLCKASSKKEGWMKSTKAMQIDGVGCVVQVTTQQRNETGMNPFLKDEDGKLSMDKYGKTVPDSNAEAVGYTIAEAVTFVPGVKIHEIMDTDSNVIERRLVSMDYQEVGREISGLESKLIKAAKTVTENEKVNTEESAA